MKANKPIEQSFPSATLKWVGGKRRLAEQIVALFPAKMGMYFEPFLGGASVFYRLRPEKAHLTDLNASLINYYIQLRDNVSGLMEASLKLQDGFMDGKSDDAKKTFYYEIRSQYNLNSSKNTLENAAQFLFLNKTAFNGIYRENARGGFNVPFNNSRNLKLFDEQQMRASSEQLRNAILEVSDFRSAVSSAKKGDLVYFDPPYIPLSSTASFTDYTKSQFGPSAQEDLRDLANELRMKGVFVVLSNSFSSQVEELYQGFELKRLEINRLVSADASSRGQICEFLIIGRPYV